MAAIADPATPAGDHVWWNRGRMPPGVSTGTAGATTVAVTQFVVPRLTEVLDRDLDSEVASVGARQALLAALS